MEAKNKMNISLTLAVLLGLGWALPAAATDYAVSDYQPLAVGNSWTYEHSHSGLDRSQWSAYTAQFPRTPQFTITVERTEVIDGKTYYVISDMPDHWPPAPPHFIAGRKLRWEGTHLMERTSNGEQAIFRFDGTDYQVSTDEGDFQVTVRTSYSNPVPKYGFDFNGGVGGGVRFLAGYGIERAVQIRFSIDVTTFINEVRPVRAVIGGRQVEHADAEKTPIDTSSSSSSWGGVKQTYFAHAPEGRTSR